MPDFIISTTGGLFTATTSWVGGVVPTSASQSHIIGLSSSGPLYFNNLGARTIGSLVLTDFTNILAFTGSATTLTVNGPTFSLGASMNYVGATSTATVVNQRIIIQPVDGATFSIFNNGVKIKRTYFSFRWSGSAVANGRIAIVDDMWLENEFYLLCHNDNAGPSVNRAIVGSATASVRAKIYFDHKNSTSNFWGGTRQLTSKGYEVDFILAGTGSGRLRWASDNYYSQKVSLPERSTFEIQSGDFRIDNNVSITKETTIKYTGGTVSGSKKLYLNHYSSTNNTDQTNVYFNTPGLQWDIVDMRHDIDLSVVGTMSLYNLNGFSTDNLLVSNASGNAGGNAFTNRVFTIYGTNSTTNLGNVIIGGTYLSIGGAFTNGFWYGWATLNFDGGKTYSLNRFQGMGAYWDDSPNITQRGRFNIVGTGSNANLSIIRNENSALWCAFTNINVVSDAKIYAFGSTWSNSTGIEGVIPTGGGGGPTPPVTTSYTWVN